MLVRQIGSYLEQMGLPVPSRKTIFRLLSHMPASTTKELRGVANVQVSLLTNCSYTSFSSIENFFSKVYLTVRINLLMHFQNITIFPFIFFRKMHLDPLIGL